MGHRRISTDTSVRDLLAALSATEAAHGAVSASAVAAGMGTALLVMVAALPKTRRGGAADCGLRAVASLERGRTGLRRSLLMLFGAWSVIAPFALAYRHLEALYSDAAVGVIVFAVAIVRAIYGSQTFQPKAA